MGLRETRLVMDEDFVTKKLILLETSAQVELMRNVLHDDHEVIMVAITADALEMAEQLGVNCDAISRYVDSRALSSAEERYNVESFSLLRQLELFTAKRKGNECDDGPGFLSGQGYHVQYVISGIVTRSYLIVETINVVKPEVVMAFQNDLDPQFRGQGYDRNPWWDIVERACCARGMRLLNASDSVLSDGVSVDLKPSIMESILNVKKCLRRYAGSVWWLKLLRDNARFILANSKPLRLHSDTKSLRLLMVGSLSYDWLHVMARLRKDSGLKCYFMNVVNRDQREWNARLDDTVYDVFKIKRVDVAGCNGDCDTIATNDAIFEEWRNEGGVSKQMNVMGMDVLPSVEKYLKSMMRICPSIQRHADDVALNMVEKVSPHAVCFYAIHTLATKRLAYQCRKRGIPVVCYQHGGAYGTHDLAKTEQLESAHADYFLTYGRGIAPRRKKAFGRRAEYVPMGSARLEANIKRRKQSIDSNVINVLWIAEITTGNTTSGSFAIEDTERYLRQKECLEMLGGQAHVKVVYRPYAYFVPLEGTTRWIARSGLKNISVDCSKALTKLIAQADIVITDTSSNTVWDEVLVMDKPMIVYCDPRQTLLLPQFREDLEKVCCWCKTGYELVGVIREFIEDGGGFIKRLRRKGANEFIEKYAIHKADGKCVERVVSFLENISTNVS